MEIFPSFGGAPYNPKSKLVIRLILKGCTNRQFFLISVQDKMKDPKEPVIEQIGSYDPLPNEHNEKLVGINFQRLEYWLRKGVEVTDPVKKILGLCGYFPVFPGSMTDAYKRRKKLSDEIESLKIEAAKFTSVNSEQISESSEESLNESSVSSSTSHEESLDASTTESQSENTVDKGNKS